MVFIHRLSVKCFALNAIYWKKFSFNWNMEHEKLYALHNSVVEFHYEFRSSPSLPSLESTSDKVQERHCTWIASPITPIKQQPFGRHPIHATCPSCHATIVTKVKLESNCTTNFLALMRFIFWFIPRVCFVRCMTSCQSSIHTCPDCSVCSDCSVWIGTCKPE